MKFRCCYSYLWLLVGAFLLLGNFVGCLYDFGNCRKRKALTIASHRIADKKRDLIFSYKLWWTNTHTRPAKTEPKSRKAFHFSMALPSGGPCHTRSDADLVRSSLGLTWFVFIFFGRAEEQKTRLGVDLSALFMLCNFRVCGYALHKGFCLKLTFFHSHFGGFVFEI